MTNRGKDAYVLLRIAINHDKSRSNFADFVMNNLTLWQF